MKRLPRKYKKQVKKIVAAKMAFKTVTASMTAAMSCAQIAIISATPFSLYGPVGIADKAVKVAQVSIDAANSIRKIMSEPPNSWKEFIQ